MEKQVRLNSIDWTCPSVESLPETGLPDRERIASMKKADMVAERMVERAGLYEDGRLVLPSWQNLEAIVIGSRFFPDGEYFLPDGYCLKDLRQMEEISCDLVGDPLIKAVIEVIGRCSGQPLILEVESPFSVLGALMNPLDLYMLTGQDEKHLRSVLDRIAQASAAYVRECIRAGCRIISIADPLGTMDLVGEEYYARVCGPVELHHLEMIEPDLDGAVVHICRKMSMSLVLADLMGVKEYRPERPAEGFLEVLSAMADQPDLFYTGLTCIHDRRPALEKSCLLYRKDR